jgi:RHS repeat-associated protein
MRAQYDQEGNMVSRTSVFDSCSYEYDALGRLCRVCSELGEEERYRYDAFNRLQEVVVYKGDKKSYSLLWFDTIEMGSVGDKGIEEIKIIHPKSRSMIGCEIRGTFYSVDCDEKGSVTALYGSYGKPIEIYRYSAFGQMHGYDTAGRKLSYQPRCPWLYCGKRRLFVGYDFGTRRYDPVFMRWFERDPLGMTDTIDDRQFVRNNPVDFFDPTGLFSWPACLKEAKDSFFEAIDFVSSNTIKTLTFAREKVDWYYDIRASFEHLFFRVLSKTWFLFIGYNPDDSSCGVCGKGKEIPNVRITAINGILNGLLEAKLSAQLISDTHGNAPVHFIYSATKGFTGDMVRAFFIKVGVATKQSQLLSKTWKKLIQEMGGVDGGGEIIHYAHSLGAIETINALKTLSIEERNMIRVATFGSPTLLPDDLCLRVDNFISTKDGVPFFDFRRSWSDLQNLQNVHVLHAETPFPFIDHLLEGKTYRGVLEVLGQEFQERYRLPLAP